MERLTTDALVLRCRDHGEADRLVHLITPRHGRIRAVARSARRPQSRLTGSLMPATRSVFTLVSGRELYTVTGARGQERFDRLHASLLPMAVATYLMEIADQSLGERDPAPEVYGLLLGLLTLLDAQRDPEALLRAGEVRMLALMGFALDLHRCVRCRGEAQAGAGFAPARGVLCARCRGALAPLGADALAALRSAADLPLPELGREPIPAQARRELGTVLGPALDQRLGRTPRSRAYLQQLLGPGAQDAGEP